MTDPPTPRGPGRARGDLVQRLVRSSIRHPRAVFTAWLAIAALAGAGIARLEIDTATSSFLDRSDPAWHFYQESLARYGGDEFVTIAVEGARPFDPAALRQVAALSEALLSEPGVLRVDSLSTVSVIAAEPDGVLTLDPPLPRPVSRARPRRSASPSGCAAIASHRAASSPPTGGCSR